MKKRQILDAGTRLYLELGYGAVSMELVAREAKVSKATLYSHFSDKRELFKEALTNYYQQEYIQFPKVPSLMAANVDELAANLEEYLHDCVNFYSNESVVRLYRLLITEIKEFPEMFELLFNKQSGQMTTNLAGYLESYVKAHKLKNINSYILACQILDLVRGATIWVRLVQNPAKLGFMDNPELILEYICNSSSLLIKNYFKELVLR